MLRPAQSGLVHPADAIEHRKVGYTEIADYTAGTLADPWHREGENSAVLRNVRVLIELALD